MWRLLYSPHFILWLHLPITRITWQTKWHYQHRTKETSNFTKQMNFPLIASVYHHHFLQMNFPLIWNSTTEHPSLTSYKNHLANKITLLTQNKSIYKFETSHNKLTFQFLQEYPITTHNQEPFVLLQKQKQKTKSISIKWPQGQNSPPFQPLAQGILWPYPA